MVKNSLSISHMPSSDSKGPADLKSTPDEVVVGWLGGGGGEVLGLRLDQRGEEAERPRAPLAVEGQDGGGESHGDWGWRSLG